MGIGATVLSPVSGRGEMDPSDMQLCIIHVDDEEDPAFPARWEGPDPCDIHRLYVIV